MPTLYRDPRVFDEDTFVNKTPTELTNGNFVGGFRNANSSSFQTYSPYRASTPLDLSNSLNTISEQCIDPIITDGYVTKYLQDVRLTQYILLKTIPVESSISDKRNDLGRLFVLDHSGLIVDDFFGITLSSIDVKDVFVFYQLVVIFTGNQAFFINTDTQSVFTESYMSHIDLTFRDGVVYFISDEILNEFALSKYDGHKIHTEDDVWIQPLTSSKLYFDKTTLTLLGTDTNLDELVIGQFDPDDMEWYYFTVDDFAYQIVGGYSIDSKWVVIREDYVYPNQVSGICVEYTPTEITEVMEDCPTTSDLIITF